jgi:DNA-binding transcriptional LysR family regulator
MEVTVDLRQLRGMLAIIEKGSVGKAAEALHVSQPALTKSIRRLEKELAVELFKRDARGMRPTIYAENLRAYAQSACNGLAQAASLMRALKNGQEGVISVAAPETITSKLFPEVIAILAERRPLLQIQVFSHSEFLYSALLRGQYDLVVSPLYNEIPQVGLAKRWLFDDHLAVVVSRQHPLAKVKSVTPEMLQKCTWVVSDGNTVHRRRVERYFGDAGLDLPYIAVESRSPAVLKEIIMRTHYVGLLSSMEVESELNQKLLRAIEIQSSVMARPVGLVWREDYTFPPAILTFVEILEVVCRRRGYIAPRPAIAERHRKSANAKSRI